MTATVRCPRCKRAVKKGERSDYYCPSCDALFDDDPDEGGDYSDFNPAARIEREERRKLERRRK